MTNRKENVKMTCIILLSVLLNCAAQILMKSGMRTVGEVDGIKGFISAAPQMLTTPALWGSAVCYIISIAVWLVVLSKVDVSYAYPFLSVGYILSAIAGYFLFAESITPVRIAGIAVICVGVILISRG